MMCLGLLAPTQFSKMTSVRIEVKAILTGTKGQAIVIGQDRNGNTLTKHLEVETGTGGSVSGIILEHGRLGLARLHILNRTNILIGFSIKNGRVVMDEDLGKHLFLRLPARLQAQSQPDNVAIESTHEKVVKLNFVTRDGRDGVKATFQIEYQKWRYVSGRYWRDPAWNGKRNF